MFSWTAQRHLYSQIKLSTLGQLKHVSDIHQLQFATINILCLFQALLTSNNWKTDLRCSMHLYYKAYYIFTFLKVICALENQLYKLLILMFVKQQVAILLFVFFSITSTHIVFLPESRFLLSKPAFDFCQFS